MYAVTHDIITWQNVRGYNRIIRGMGPPHYCRCYGRILIKLQLTGKSLLNLQFYPICIQSEFTCDLKARSHLNLKQLISKMAHWVLYGYSYQVYQTCHVMLFYNNNSVTTSRINCLRKVTSVKNHTVTVTCCVTLLLGSMTQAFYMLRWSHNLWDNCTDVDTFQARIASKP